MRRLQRVCFVAIRRGARPRAGGGAAALLLMLAGLSVARGEVPPPGHSLHGETFSEGPRQFARLMGDTGDVHFPVTTTQPEVQAFIDQGLGQLHGYWYFEAERSFRHAATLDPDCAIAYWGMALANINNATRAQGFIEEADRKKEHASDREKKYIAAWKAFWDKTDSKEANADINRRKALVKAYERIIDDDPDDLEAKALLISQLWDNHGHGIPITAFYPVDALIKEVLAVNPRHPVHHYRIHLWDYENAAHALEAAANCGQAAPGIAHMWHMPGHIYSRLNRYHDACWQQEASARVDHAYMIQDHILPDQIHNYAHNNEWFTRNLMKVGRMGDALQMAQCLIQNPQHPALNTLHREGSLKFGRQRLCDVLSEFELWDEAIALSETVVLEPTADVEEQLRRLRLLGRAHFRRGDFSAGAAILTEILERRIALRIEQQTAMRQARDEAVAASQPQKKIDEAESQARNRFNDQINSLDRAAAELSGYVHVAAGAYADALTAFEKAGRFDSAYVAEVQRRAGKPAEALETVRREVRAHDQEVLPLAQLVEELWRQDQRDEALLQFKALQAISGDLDPTAPITRRLTEIATAAGLPTDWQQPFPEGADVGRRPPLDSLGPFAWHPWNAADWQLPDEGQRLHSMAEFAGKPVVVLFSLGASCLHCNEQLKAFVEGRERFERAGLAVVAISTDPVENLQLSLSDWRKAAGPAASDPPLLLLADPRMRVFRSYRCYDDFEQAPLHGTFVIDGRGQVLWQDVGPEPFTDIDFLLAETARQLSFKRGPDWSEKSNAPPPPLAFPRRPERTNLRAGAEPDVQPPAGG